MTLTFCDECGFRNRAGARFCARCGNTLAEDSEAGGGAAELDSQTEPTPAGARATRRFPRPSSMVLGIIGAALLIVLFFAVYSAMASRAYSAAVDAHKRFDCSEAADKYGQVVGFYSLAFPSHRATAKARRAECRAVLEAESAAQARNHRGAAQLYGEILDEHGDSPILAELRVRRADELLWWGDSVARRARNDADLFPVALRRYETVIAEPETPEDNAARTRMANLWNSAISGGVCGRADRMLALAAADDYVTDEGKEFQRSATERAPRDMLGCGNHLIAERQYGAAIRVLRLVAREYRGTQVAARARSSLIDARVGQIRGGGTSKLPAPANAGYIGGTEAAIVIENSSPYNLEILLSGPGSRRFTVPRCAECRKFSSPSEVTGCPSGPTRTFVVQPGTYSAVVRDTARQVKPWAGDLRVDAGYRYDEGCFYIVTSLPVSAH
jgi:hypothetical protein